MRKQYLPQVKYNGYRKGEWVNVMSYDVNGNKRYAETLEEAKQAIENTKKMWEDDRKGNGRVIKEGQISVSVEPSKDDTFTIVESRIRVREVTEWKEVE